MEGQPQGSPGVKKIPSAAPLHRGEHLDVQYVLLQTCTRVWTQPMSLSFISINQKFTSYLQVEILFINLKRSSSNGNADAVLFSAALPGVTVTKAF